MNDVINELQREKQNDRQQVQSITAKHQQCQKRLELLEVENSTLRQENDAKVETIERLRNKVEELQRNKVERKEEQDIVVTEVNECEENC